MKPLPVQVAKDAREEGQQAFARQMMQELHRLTGQVHALTTLLQHYVGHPDVDTNTPQPAPFPGAQSEGSGNHGGDQRAQKSEAGPAATEAGAAQAGTHVADRRNSSQPAGGVASAPLPADRTRTDHALDLWSTTDLTEQQIAEQVGCALGSVKAFVSAARKKDDPRAYARKLPHDEKLSQPQAPNPQTVLIPRKDEDREPPVSGFAKPVERKPFSKPLDPRPGRLAGVVITSPGSVVALDMDNLIVACPGGDWQVSRPVALIMERMRNGDTFAHEVLAELGSMGSSAFADSRKRWTEELAKRGVAFISTKGVGCRIEVAK